MITDVPVERTQSGQLLLYRLLNEYPSHQLRIVQSTRHATRGAAFRIPEVEYRYVHYPVPRLLSSRWNPLGAWMQTCAMRRYDVEVARGLEGFEPKAVLTVTHDYLWLNAARFAESRRLPLHLICHDDWESMIPQARSEWFSGWTRGSVTRHFRRVYQNAQSHLCVSPGMVDLYEARYSVRGEVLYPSRGEDSPEPIIRVGRNRDRLNPVIAFAGALHTEGARDLLRKLARILGAKNGHLDLYTNDTEESLGRIGLEGPVVRRQGFFPPKELADRIAETAHILFLPASFHPRERTDVSTLFPSKLADYTAIGLPILIWGPEYSSAVRWGQERSDATMMETSEHDGRVSELIDRCMADVCFAERIAENGVAAGRQDFDLDSARETFYRALSSVERAR